MWCRVLGSRVEGFRVQGFKLSGFRALGVGFQVLGLEGFRVHERSPKPRGSRALIQEMSSHDSSVSDTSSREVAGQRWSEYGSFRVLGFVGLGA